MAHRVLVVHAHPDGETVWTGATIARLVADGSAVTVLTATRGERSDVIDASLREAGSQAIAATRARELGDALGVLGVSDHRFLGAANARWSDTPRRYTDSSGGVAPAAEDEADRLDSLALSAPEEIAADIAAVIADVRPDLVIGYGADGLDGHPDRRIIGENARWAARALNVPYFEILPPGEVGSVTVDEPHALARRAQALRAYPSRIRVDAESFRLPTGAPHPLDLPESFRRVRPQPTGFASFGIGARILACFFALVLGVFAGLVLTFAHQSTVRVGDLTVPWGVIAALVLSAALLAGLRIVYTTRLVTGAAALGLLGVVALLSLAVGGSVVVPDNDAGRVWTIGVVLITAVVLAWPRIERRGGDRMESPAAKGSEQP